jgi:hypothetical protein
MYRRSNLGESASRWPRCDLTPQQIADFTHAHQPLNHLSTRGLRETSDSRWLPWKYGESRFVPDKEAWRGNYGWNSCHRLLSTALHPTVTFKSGLGLSQIFTRVTNCPRQLSFVVIDQLLPCFITASYLVLLARQHCYLVLLAPTYCYLVLLAPAISIYIQMPANDHQIPQFTPPCPPRRLQIPRYPLISHSVSSWATHLVHHGEMMS